MCPTGGQAVPARRRTDRSLSEEGSPTPSQHKSDMPWLGDPSGSWLPSPFQRWASAAGYPTNRLLPSSLVEGSSSTERDRRSEAEVSDDGAKRS